MNDEADWTVGVTAPPTTSTPVADGVTPAGLRYRARVLRNCGRENDAVLLERTAERIEALDEARWSGWSPTPAEVNALPEPLRSYIHQLEPPCDQSGDMKELAVRRDLMTALQRVNEELRAEIARLKPNE